MRLLHAIFVMAAAFLTLSEAAEVTSPITVPLHFTETGAGTYKLGIYAGIGDGGKPALFELDTGGAGLYAAYASANVSRSDWWGSGVVSQNQTIHIVYDSGNTYNGTLVSAPVSLYSAHHSTAPLVTIPPALLGQMNQISKTNQNNGHVTPLWGPDGELNGEPPVNGVFYGDFGMAPKYAPNGISNLIAQMTYSSNVTAGFRVHADPANQTAWLRIGLTAEDLAEAGPLVLPMNVDTTANGTLTPNANLRFFSEQLFNATIQISGSNQHVISPGVGITPDTGAGTTLHNTQNSSQAQAYANLITWTNQPADTLGDLMNHLDFRLSATNTSNQPVEFFNFRTNEVVDGGNVDVQNNRSNTLYYLNTGILLFYNYDLVYDLANGLVGFVPLPPSTLYWVGSNGTSWTAADNWSASTTASSGNATLALDGSQGVVFASSGANASATASTVLDRHATITRLTVSSAHPVSIGGSGTLTINSSSDTAISIESNAGNVTISAPVVFAGNSGAISVKGVNPLLSIALLGGSNGLQKTGNGTLQLTGASTYTGGTTLSGGTLRALHANALGSGELYLSSGTLAVGSASHPNLGLVVPGHLHWAEPHAVVSLADGGNITASGDFTHGGNPGNRTFDFGSGHSLQLGNNSLVNFGATTFTASDFLATASSGTSLSGNFQIVGNSLVYVLQGGSASGSVINNSGSGGTPTWVDFTINGSVTTATGNSTIRNLAFANNGNLAIQAGNSLTLSQGQVAVENGSSAVSGGTLATPGNFNKAGAGELDVQSILSVNGTASIDAGLLSVNGNLIANAVAVNSGATLGGSGTIFAPVTVSGTLAPGNSPGTLSMAALALTPTAVTNIEIESLTNFDRLVVSGAATVDGTLNIIPYNDTPLTYGQQYAFLTAGGGISGEFDTINAPATFRGRFLNQRTTGVLLIAPDTYTRVAVTPNQREVAKALDSFIPATSGDREAVSTALDLQPAGQYPTAFEQIMPGFYESLANIAIEQTYNQAQLLIQRMGMVRLGTTGFQAIGLSQPIKYDKDGKSTADAKTASPIVESAIDTNWNSWVVANGEFSLSRGLPGVPDYKNNAGGFLVGADYRLSENFAAGLFAGYEYSYAKYDGGSSTRVNSALFGLYGSYTHEDGYYADAIVSGGYTGFQTRRSIEFSTIDRTARADPNSGQFSTAVNLGKDFEVGKFTLGPIVGAQYTYAGIGGFKESGADSLDLALGQQNANSFRTNLGARLAYNWEAGSNITLIPEVRGFWMHEFLNGPRNINSALDGGSGPSFDYETSAPYPNSVFGGVGISAKIGDRWSASVFYNVNFGAQTYTNNIISTSVGFAF